MPCGFRPTEMSKDQHVSEFYRTLSEELIEKNRDLRARLDEALDGREQAEIRAEAAESTLAQRGNSTAVAGGRS